MINQQGIISVNPASATLGRIHGLDTVNPYRESEAITQLLKHSRISPAMTIVKFILAGDRRYSRCFSRRIAAIRLACSALTIASAVTLSSLAAGIMILLIICSAMMAAGFLTRPAAAISAAVLSVAMAAGGLFCRNPGDNGCRSRFHGYNGSRKIFRWFCSHASLQARSRKASPQPQTLLLRLRLPVLTTGPDK